MFYLDFICSFYEIRRLISFGFIESQPFLEFEAFSFFKICKISRRARQSSRSIKFQNLDRIDFLNRAWEFDGIIRRGCYLELTLTSRRSDELTFRGIPDAVRGFDILAFAGNRSGVFVCVFDSE